MRSKLNWLVRHGVKLRRAGISWVASLDGHVVNHNHSRRELIREVFRELTMS